MTAVGCSVLHRAGGVSSGTDPARGLLYDACMNKQIISKATAVATAKPMTSKRKTAVKMDLKGTTARSAELRRMLIGRRSELQAEVESGIRSGRSGRPKEGGDNLEDSDAAVQGDIALSLLQMRAEMLARIELAIVRLDAGRYGSCAECDEDITERRLSALPFAVRCQACEQRREQLLGRAERQAQQRGSFWLLSDKTGS